MRDAGTTVMVIAAFAVVGLALARGRVPFLLMRQSRRPGEPPIVTTQARRHLKAADRVPEWFVWLPLAFAVAGWLLSRYG